ncbi:MAG: caspase family protein [Myxococcales bacterium]|nr:caspase family protein [Myxococcales bacterium]
MIPCFLRFVQKRTWVSLLRLWLLTLVFFPSQATAKDIRVALLVGNQQGWKEDPKLHYALRGDLRPFAEKLRRLGFIVHTVQNQDAHAFRQAMSRIEKRAKRAPHITTFLFYYTGHADKSRFHTGPRSNVDVTYPEFATFLRKLPIQRRFAILDACFSGEIIRQFGSMQQFKELIRKGVRRLRPLDLSQNFPNQGEEQGLQIISSSLDSAWESQRYKASIFTHHLLQGLQGPADRDHDGKISIEELFAYVSQEMARETRQKPYLFGVYQRANTYALAPAYGSRLWIGPKVVGHLQVSVANFLWVQKKRATQAFRLAVVPGDAVIDLQHKGRCWRQKVQLPKGQEARLSEDWSSIRCRSAQTQRKGHITLPLESLEPAPPEESHLLEFHGGTKQSFLLRGSFFGGGEIGWRHRYFGLKLGLWGTQIPYQEQSYSQLFFELQGEIGYRKSFSFLDLFLGVGVGYGVLIQDLNSQPNAGGIFRYGGVFQANLWFHERVAFSARLSAGFELTQLGYSWQNHFSWQAMLGLSIRLDLPLRLKTWPTTP